MYQCTIIGQRVKDPALLKKQRVATTSLAPLKLWEQTYWKLETGISVFALHQPMYWKLASTKLETETETIGNQYFKYRKPIHRILETNISSIGN